MRYYIADQHFYHKNLLKRIDKRPFDTIEEMNQHMIDQWNSKVKDNDEVYILGDFSVGNGEQTSQILRELRGIKYLIVGNYDKMYLNDPNFNLRLFKWVAPYAEVREKNHAMVCLSHYPMMSYNGQYRYDEENSYATFMLYGHTHCTSDESRIRNYQINTMSTEAGYKSMKLPCNLINCFCMFSDYVPLTLEEWVSVRNSQLIIQDRINKRLGNIN